MTKTFGDLRVRQTFVIDNESGRSSLFLKVSEDEYRWVLNGPLGLYECNRPEKIDRSTLVVAVNIMGYSEA